jgi:hypothetical protein
MAISAAGEGWSRAGRDLLLAQIGLRVTCRARELLQLARETSNAIS